VLRVLRLGFDRGPGCGFDSRLQLEHKVRLHPVLPARLPAGAARSTSARSLTS